MQEKKFYNLDAAQSISAEAEPGKERIVVKEAESLGANGVTDQASPATSQAQPSGLSQSRPVETRCQCFKTFFFSLSPTKRPSKLEYLSLQGLSRLV